MKFIILLFPVWAFSNEKIPFSNTPHLERCNLLISRLESVKLDFPKGKIECKTTENRVKDFEYREYILFSKNNISLKINDEKRTEKINPPSGFYQVYLCFKDQHKDATYCNYVIEPPLKKKANDQDKKNYVNFVLNIKKDQESMAQKIGQRDLKKLITFAEGLGTRIPY